MENNKGHIRTMRYLVMKIKYWFFNRELNYLNGYKLFKLRTMVRNQNQSDDLWAKSRSKHVKILQDALCELYAEISK